MCALLVAKKYIIFVDELSAISRLITETLVPDIWSLTTYCVTVSQWKRATFTFWITPWNIGRFNQLLVHNIVKTLDVNIYSFGQLTLILLLHYLVKFISRGLGVCNNEFILGSACVDSEMINWIVQTRVTVIISQKVLVLRHVIFITECAQNASCRSASGGGWRDSPTAHSITRDPERLTRCWCVISVRRCSLRYLNEYNVI